MTIEEIEGEISECLLYNIPLENILPELLEEYITVIKEEVGKSPTAFTSEEVKKYTERYKYLVEVCDILNKRNMDDLGL